jgi:hypothetical protein
LLPAARTAGGYRRQDQAAVLASAHAQRPGSGISGEEVALIDEVVAEAVFGQERCPEFQVIREAVARAFRPAGPQRVKDGYIAGGLGVGCATGLAGWSAALAAPLIPGSAEQISAWLAGLADAAVIRYLEYGCLPPEPRDLGPPGLRALLAVIRDPVVIAGNAVHAGHEGLAASQR